MKSRPQENKIVETPCKDCVFCDNQFEKQVGCKAGRLPQFIKRKEAVKHEDEFYSISRFCNLFRNSNWKFSSDADALEKAKDEVKASFCIVVFDSVHDSKIEESVDSIFDLDYPDEKIQVIISTFYQEDLTKYIDMANRLKARFNNSKLVINTLNSVRTQIEYDAFSKVANKSYFVKIDDGMTLPKDILTQIDDSLNIKVEKVVAFEYNSEKGKAFALPFGVVSNEYLKYNNFDMMCDGVIESAKQSNLFKQIDEK